MIDITNWIHVRFNLNRSRKNLVCEYNAIILHIQFILDCPFVSFRCKYAFCQLAPALNDMYFEICNLLKADSDDKAHAKDLSAKIKVAKLEIPVKVANKIAKKYGVKYE